MKISRIGEFGLIERIKKSVGNQAIGSDCAPIVLNGQTYLITCDIMLEGRHFLRRFDPADIGYKSMAVNVSDIVASGGTPQYALVSLILPDIDASYVDGLYKGMKAASKKFGCRIMGGNVSRGDKIGVDIFMVGSAKKFIPRNSCSIGDYIFVTGTLGDSRAGLELLTKKSMRLEAFEKILIRRHLKPEIDINTANYLAKNATSSMDVSDGISSDLYQLFGETKLKVFLSPGKIPLSKEFKMFCKKYRYDAISYAIKGGEDYRILFTQPKKESIYHEIGRVENGRGIFFGQKKIVNESFDHFRS
ncbi:MAG: thiamine-phosphate kinase [Patescibacteria group bacterium]